MLHYSIRFWVHHKKQCLLIFFTIMFSSVAMFFLLCTIRGMMVEQYQDTLDHNGNYNYLLISPTKKQVEELEKEACFQELGILYDEGKIVSDKNKTGIEYQLASVDKTGEELYHLRCQKGRYPETEGELAVTEDMLKRLGAAPALGEKIKVTRIVHGKSKIVSYRVCGLLKSIDRNWVEEREAPYPDAFVYNEEKEDILCVVGVENPDASSITGYLQREGIQYQNEAGRSVADSFYLDTERASVNDTEEKLADATVRDFESAVLIPIFAVVLCILVAVSLLYAMVSVLKNRRESIAVYCLLGMTNRRAKQMLVLELLVIVLVSWIAGILLGSAGYYGITKLLKEVFFLPVSSAFDANEVIRAVSLNPISVTSSMIFCAAFCAIAIQLYRWDFVNAMEAIRAVNKKNRKKFVRKLTPFHILNVGCWNNISNFFVIFVILSTLFFFSLYFSAKCQVDSYEYQEGLKNAQMGDYDYLMSRDFTKSDATILMMNRWDSGVAPEDMQILKEAKEIGRLQCSMELPEILVMEEDKQKGKKLGQSYQEVIEQVMGDYYSTDFYENDYKLQGYDTEDVEKLHNVAMVGLDNDSLHRIEDEMEILDGAIHEEALQSGREVLIAVYNKEGSGTYSVGEEIVCSDVLLDKTDSAYSFEFKYNEELPKNSGTKYKYKKIYEENKDEVIWDTGWSYGYRKDFKTVVGGIVYLKGGKNSFYYRESRWGNNHCQMLCGVNAPKEWGLPHRNYTKLGITLKSKRRNEDFLRPFYKIYANSSDMRLKSVYEFRQAIWQKEFQYGSVLLTIGLLLLFLGLLSVYHCIKLRLLNDRQQIGILQLLGMEKKQIQKIYIFSYLKYIGVNLVLAWIPVLLFLLKEHYIYRKSQEILKALGGTGEISREIKLITDEGIDTGWLYNLRGGSYNLLDQPYIMIYIIVIGICSAMILLFINRLVKKSIKGDILANMRTEE